MKIIFTILLFCSFVFAEETKFNPQPELAQVPQIDTQKAAPRIMGMYEQGWGEGAELGNQNSGKIGWFLAGFGNLPFLWMPWAIEPRRPAKPPIQAEAEYNSGFKNGYRAGWKNAHKTYYIAGMIVESAAAAAIIASQ